MRLKLVPWDNFTSSPEIVYCILFSSDNSFVLCHGGKLIFIVTIFNPSDCCLLKGYKVLSPRVFCDHTTGGGGWAMFQELKTTLLYEESVTWKIMTSVVAKI